MISKIIKKQFSTAGSLVTWGQTTFGWGRPIDNNFYTPALVQGFNDVTSVSSGPCHLLFQTKNKQVYSTGLGDNGRLGHGSDKTIESPQLIEGLRGLNISQLAAGQRHSLALTEGGDVYAWGYGGRIGGIWNYLSLLRRDSPCGLGETNDVLTPTLVEEVSGVQQISAGSDFSLAVGSDGKVYGWGQNIVLIGQQKSSKPVALDDINYLLHKTHSNIVKVSSTDVATFFLLQNGRIYVVGQNNGGFFATRHNPRVIEDNQLINLTQIVDQDFKGQKIVSFENSSNSLIFRTESGSIFYSGMFNKFRPTPFPYNGQVKNIFATYDSVGVIGSDGSVNYLNDKFIDNSVKKGDLIVCKDPLFSNTITIGGTHRLRYALVSE